MSDDNVESAKVDLRCLCKISARREAGMARQDKGEVVSRGRRGREPDRAKGRRENVAPRRRRGGASPRRAGDFCRIAK